MPYSIAKRGNEYCVVKDSDGSTVGCHGSRRGAQGQIAALNIAKANKNSEVAGPWAHAQSVLNEAAQMQVTETHTPPVNVTKDNDLYIGLTLEHRHDPLEEGGEQLIHSHPIPNEGVNHLHPGYAPGFLQKREVPDPYHSGVIEDEG